MDSKPKARTIQISKWKWALNFIQVVYCICVDAFVTMVIFSCVSYLPLYIVRNILWSFWSPYMGTYLLVLLLSLTVIGFHSELRIVYLHLIFIVSYELYICIQKWNLGTRGNARAFVLVLNTIFGHVSIHACKHQY
jgi:hypothetical protein